MKSKETEKEERRNNQSMLDYYVKNGLNPDFVPIEKEEVWKSHYSKRINLYQNHLKIPFSLLKNASILEFGCNSGENSLVLASAGANLTLVEPNQHVRPRLIELYKKFGFEEQMELDTKDIQIFESNKKYDIIIAEGFLFSLPNREEMVKKISNLLNQNGLGVISFMDKYGGLLEFIKKMVLFRICQLRKRDVGDVASLEFAKKLYLEDFKKLNTTRPFEVWWTELVEGPSYKSYCLWSYPEFLYLLEKLNCEFYSSSPQWDTSNNHIWYKNISEKRNDKVLESWRQNFTFFLTGLAPHKESTSATLKTINSVKELIKNISKYAEGAPIDSIVYPKELDNYLKKSKDQRLVKLNYEMKRLFKVIKSSKQEEIFDAYSNSKYLRSLWGSLYHYVCFRKI